ncbi:hypothetical protein A2130_02280 [Candidatus Woesebacteria bacterium GWC2_33_12]|uniref:Uncharacterized protein n=1 Tax=Candidatus Woesebacteria bacterium GW2011_GWB1_33_22 TaxID=1618566 RepID=A0A0F9ZIA5_9BACT|nr:MAG: hypothetical protein UR29_C0016G0009 [Candidatus Woesebacteria bacterium GW2011_GWC2_33_12]KKP41508.1 MAG: hypothetical protein UR33_C0014G0009 [Candidatus Woesebacteria bacterium GW2011_GWA2_33_20]KKP43933.1 MAG: hypothetical protein UR35_C0014G0006 [Candidatus Woesebacteria bacterium GW2011_GWB1_33_22]KKP45656.1 MAG: hypothetical protein UR37_C0016G0006 [Microgenomates group bacterium GW2011_GWC1_33_28]KKP49437.1 MAG: hypothetical protein UR41_C0015G0006 [Candidatus Woesebacteria bact
MVTLTYASITARKSIRYFIYFIIFLIVGRVVLNGTIALYKKIFPPAPEPATVAFGKLPKLPFPEKTKKDLKFTLETANGEIPLFPLKVSVYFMPKKSANLLSLDFTKDMTKKLGFSLEPQQISDSIYKFNHKSSLAILETDIITNAFSISYDLNADPLPISVKSLQPEISASTVKSFLNSGGLLAEDLTGEVKHQFLKTQGGNFIPAVSLSDASITRVDIFRKKYNELPIVTNESGKANVWFMVSGIREKGRDIIAGEYHYFPIDETKLATYPIKTGSEAWQEFINGNYYSASFGTTIDGNNIKIRKVYLAYYDPGVYTEFFQPIYVFEGDNDFVGYVPAVTSEYYGE